MTDGFDFAQTKLVDVATGPRAEAEQIVAEMIQSGNCAPLQAGLLFVARTIVACFSPALRDLLAF